MTVAATLFDLDGTLVDSLADIGEATNHALGALGFPRHPLDRYRNFVGDGIGMLAERALPAGQKDHRDELLQRLRPYYQAHCCDRTQLYPGVADMLDGLVKLGVRLAIVSNKVESMVHTVRAKLLPRWDFGVALGQRDDLPRKPDPAMAHAAAAALGVEAERCLFVGDTDVDIRTGRSAGMTAVGVEWGFRDRGELEAAGAHHVISAPADLLSLL